MSPTPISPAPPAGLKRAGRGLSLWIEVTDALNLDRHELAMLGEGARCIDLLDLLDRVVRRDGAFLPDGRINPAVIEARQQRVALARIIASLRLPEDLAEPERRPQRRGAARSPYILRAVGGGAS